MYRDIEENTPLIASFMFYLAFAILLSVAILIAFRLFEKFRIDNVQAICVNYLVASAFGFLTMPGTPDFSSIHKMDWFFIAILTGITLILTFYLFALSSQKAGVAVTAVSSKMSVIIPVLLGLTYFQEITSALKIIGIILALSAFYMTFHVRLKGKINWRFIFLPFLLFLGNGISDSLLKISQELYISGDYVYFLAFAFMVSMVVGIIIMIIVFVYKKRKPDLRSLLGGSILGLLNWGSTYFFILGLASFDVSFFVPVFNISLVILGTLTGVLFFSEKFKILNWAGIIAAILAILLIALS